MVYLQNECIKFWCFITGLPVSDNQLFSALVLIFVMARKPLTKLIGPSLQLHFVHLFWRFHLNVL